MDNFLIKQETYLEAGIHIGTKIKLIDMTQFIYRMRNDGLYVLDLRKIDERIRMAGKVLAKYEPGEVLVVASRTYSGNAAAVFSDLTGIKVFSGRFIPGILTNVARDDFMEPKALLVCDPKGERQAVNEAGKMGIATIGLCDTDNSTTFIDWVVPCNNKGRRSLALIFYLLTREYLMGKGKIASYDEFTTPLSAFEAEKGEEAEAAAPEGAQAAAAPNPAEAAVVESTEPASAKEEAAEAVAEIKAEEAGEKPAKAQKKKGKDEPSE
ncbi:30S ribosomal protein S2 [uncultured archaeon]|nr:30S ribosomal protein S2 [uncultured archaeon]